MDGVRDTIDVRLLHMRDWTTDDNVPQSLMAFASKARMASQQIEASTDRDAAPIMVMCATGVHRSGTFVALDILMRRQQVIPASHRLNSYSYRFHST